jgi:hypothetical protein
MLTDSSAASDCVAFSESGESAGSHGAGFALADASHGDLQAVEGEVR